MMWIAGMVGICYGILFILSLKENADNTRGVKRVFRKSALYLYKLVCRFPVSCFDNPGVATDLESMHPQQRREQLCAEYYVDKIERMLILFAGGTVLCTALSVKVKQGVRFTEEYSVQRENCVGEASSIDLLATVGENRECFTVVVGNRELTYEEASDLCEEFWEEVEKTLPGQNESLQDVQEDLFIRETYEAYPFSVAWKSSDTDIVRSTGEVLSQDTAREVTLMATAFYGDWNWNRTFEIRVVPPVRSERELLYERIQAVLLRSEEQSRTADSWQLPEELQSEQFAWEQAINDYSVWLWGGVFLLVIAIFFLMDRDLHTKVEENRKIMKREYPEVLHKLALYLGAGMTVRASMEKLASSYSRSLQNGCKRHPLYDEILRTCRELQTGVSEGAAYEHFGRRTGLQEYIRLSGMLTQNLKKGNRMLLDRLREEADKAFVEKIQNGRKLGEEASTKLLLPMVLFLLVVMVMVMMPAFSSMGG